MKISIIGTGIYGLSLALTIANNNHEVLMWSESKELVDNFKQTHSLNSLTNIKIPKNINLTNNISETLNNPDLIIMVTSAKYVRETCHNMKPYYDNNIPIAIASKGIENNTCSFLSDIVKDTLNTKHIAIISGPTFAIDLINLEPAALSIATKSTNAFEKLKMALQSNHLKLRINNDIHGTEICGSIKNVIAIASGILDGLGYPESTRAFLLTESLNDIKQLLKDLKYDPNTVLSYAGIGDLILTASSIKSRNYQFGILLGKNTKENEIQEYLKNNTVEGYYTLQSYKTLIEKNNINLPIINTIYDIAINHKNPKSIIEFIINKD